MHRQFSLSAIFTLLAFLGIVVAGCESLPSSPGLGATVGGAQDIGYARQIIESGGIPEPEYIVAEGLYSQHDIPAPQGECKERLCLALGYGYALAVDENAENVFVHLGLTSNVKPEEFRRPDLQLALVVDRSGSMSGGRIAAVKDALRSLVPKLTANDVVALVDFDHRSTVRMKARGMNESGRAELLRQIDRIETEGSTNIEAGLLDGYEEIARLTDKPGTEKRVMLFTDANPTVGATDKNSFRGVTQRYADEGIGLTAFGVGVDFGQELVYHISRLRGGNFFFLQNEDRIREIFDEEFEYLVTPVVHDLKIRIETPPGAQLVDVYGLPDWEPGDKDAVLEIPTVFFSKNRGAIILRYKATSPDEYAIASDQVVATGDISFTDPDGDNVADRRELRHSGAALIRGSRHFSHDGTRLGVALTNTYLALRLACVLHKDGNRTEALSMLQRGIDYATTENAVLNNAGLAVEIALMEKLRGNIIAVAG